MNKDPIPAPQPDAVDRELELLANTGLTRDDLVRTMGEDSSIQGMPKMGTPEFAEMQTRLRAQRTPEEIAELQAHDNSVIDDLEQQFN